MSDIQRGLEAHRILNADLYKEAFQVIEERLLNEMATVEIKPERAEYLRQLITVGRKYRGYLEQVMVSGQLAEQHASLMDRLKGKKTIF